jgi:hypothetical protein
MSILKFLLGLSQKAITNRAPPSWVTPDLEKVQLARNDAELVVLLSDHNGYVREAAVTRAAALLLPTILPHLIPRINDWVPEVRLAANKAVEAYLLADKFNDVLDALPSIYWLRSCERTDHTAFIDHLEKFLVKHRRASEIPTTLTKRAGIQARSMFDLSWKYNLRSKAELIRAGLASRDILTVRRSYRAIEQLPEHERLVFGRQLLQEKSGWLRYDGLRIVSRFDPPAAKRAAVSSLLAEYVPLRELAEKLTGQSQEGLSLLRKETLRNKQSNNAAIRTAIKLCGVLKDQSCEMLLEPFLGHEYPTFRGYALLALTRISPGKHNENIFELLHDETSSISRSAVTAFIEGGLSLTPDKWRAYARSTKTSSHFQRLSALARRMNKWDHLGMLLEFTTQEKFPGLIKSQMRAWLNQFNNSPVDPTQSQLQWIGTNLSKYVGKSPSAAELAFYLPRNSIRHPPV